MKKSEILLKGNANRRSFLKNGMIAVGAVTASTGMLTGGMTAFGRKPKGVITVSQEEMRQFYSSSRSGDHRDRPVATIQGTRWSGGHE